MLPHKEIDAFIKKYNNTFKLRGYSKMNVAQKNKLMEDKVKAVHDSAIKSEFTRLKAKHAKKMKKKLDDDTKPKPASAPAPKRALPKVPKKKKLIRYLILCR